MNIIEEVLDILREEEGFASYPYKDSDGGLTIGYGANLLQEPLTTDEADFILLYRVEKRVNGLLDHVDFWSELPFPARVVLIAMAYQMGVRGVLDFRKTLRYMYQKQWEKAADEMLDSKWAREDSPRRARRMAARIRALAS
jgi:lysozyme